MAFWKYFIVRKPYGTSPAAKCSLPENKNQVSYVKITQQRLSRRTVSEDIPGRKTAILRDNSIVNFFRRPLIICCFCLFISSIRSARKASRSCTTSDRSCSAMKLLLRPWAGRRPPGACDFGMLAPGVELLQLRAQADALGRGGGEGDAADRELRYVIQHYLWKCVFLADCICYSEIRAYYSGIQQRQNIIQ